MTALKSGPKILPFFLAAGMSIIAPTARAQSPFGPGLEQTAWREMSIVSYNALQHMGKLTPEFSDQHFIAVPEFIALTAIAYAALRLRRRVMKSLNSRKASGAVPI